MSIVIWIFAPLIGLVLSLFAAGGGMIAVPLLSFGVGIPLKQAIAMSLIIVASVSALALLHGKRWQHIEWKLHRFFAFGSMSGGFLGASIGLSISNQVQGIIFALLTLVVAWWMHSDVMKRITAAAQTTPCDCKLCFFAGLMTGVVTGLTGVGGGFLIVPLLLMLGVASYQSAVAHSLILIVPTSLIAAARYAENVDMVWHPTILIIVLAMLGAAAGNVMMKRYSPNHLQKGFSLMLVLVAVWMLIKVVHGL
ncbi:MAG: sulfite exporter TauE/SafE family protein [Mariprofundaceae bacterium]|nr:sulfite exporter TauE/SafE family protein [Mariprofundaceae bacterium]